MAPLFTPEKEPTGAEMTPEERRVLQGRLDRVSYEKTQALANPGPTWKEWLFYDAFKWWFAILFLIVDSWIAVQWIVWNNYVGLGLSLAAAAYAEFLIYRYLWTEAPLTRRRGAFRPTWYSPVEYGRWTEEGRLIREGYRIETEQEGPQSDEFL